MTTLNSSPSFYGTSFCELVSEPVEDDILLAKAFVYGSLVSMALLAPVALSGAVLALTTWSFTTTPLYVGVTLLASRLFWESLQFYENISPTKDRLVRLRGSIQEVEADLQPYVDEVRNLRIHQIFSNLESTLSLDRSNPIYTRFSMIHTEYRELMHRRALDRKIDQVFREIALIPLFCFPLLCCCVCDLRPPMEQ